MTLYPLRATHHRPGNGELTAPEHEVVVGGLIELLPAAVYLAEPGVAGRWLYASPQVQAVLGFAPEDFRYDQTLWNRQLHPADRERVLDVVAGADHTGRTSLEYRMFRRDGQVVWVLDDARLSELPRYGLVRHGLLHDITERKLGEEKLRRHAAILELIAHGAEVCRVLTEVAAATEAISGAARCVMSLDAKPGLSYSVEGVVDDGWLRQLGPAAHVAHFHAPDGGQLGHLALHYPDGPVQRGDAALVEWAAGLATVGVQRDAQHTRFTNSMSLLQATLDSTADGIVVVDLNGTVVGHNQRFVDMWNLDQEAIDSQGSDYLLAAIRPQLCDPELAERAARQLRSDTAATSYDELEFLDGRVFERFSQPQWVHGEPVGRVWSFRDMTLHRQLERELRARAFQDSLTPLPNRAYFMDELTSALTRAGQRPGSLAVLLLDLDDFKTVNDSLGHLPGDNLLIAVAARLQSSVRAGDLAARLGGDEFALLLDGLNGPHDAVAAAERLLAEVSRPLTVDGQQLTIRASIGVAVPTGTETAAELLRNADLAMYNAKRDGGGRCHRYAAAMHAEAVARLELKAELERAVDADELVVHYQPVWDLNTGEIVSLEALVRWPHPERGLIPPCEFIPLAEESSLIDRLGSLVLGKACAQLSTWRRTNPRYAKLAVSVNLSPRQLSDERLTDNIRQALWVAGLPASALILEITETSLASPNVDVVKVLSQLKAIGVGLALDDFGVGYSSLTQLVRFPLDIVKIDKAFVDRIVEDEVAAALFRAVLQVTEALSLSATVEGVEDGEQLAQIRALGCDRAQGYLLARPMAAADVTELLSRHATAALPRTGS